MKATLTIRNYKIELSVTRLQGGIGEQLTHRFDNGKLVLNVDGNVDELYTITYPYLISKNYPCTYYTTSNFQEDWLGGGEALEMHNAGMDMQCHSDTHPHFMYLTSDELQTQIENNNDAFIAAGIPTPVHHAYPSGSNDHTAKAIISKYRLTGRKYDTVPDNYTYFYRDVDKYMIPGCNIDEGTLTTYMDTIKSKLDEAQDNKGAFSVMWHTNTESGIALLDELITYAEDIGMDIINVSQLYDLLWRNYLVAVHVVDQLGNDMPDATVTIDGAEYETDRQGHVTFIKRDGSYSITIERDDCDTHTDNFIVSGANVYHETIITRNDIKPFIGEEYGGGLIAHIFEVGEHGYVEGEQRGFIVARKQSLEDLDNKVQWGCQGTKVGTTFKEIGYGGDNTTDIIALHAGWVEGDGWENGNGIGGVGDTCNIDNDGDVVAINVDGLAIEGYNDWVLPSIDELQKIRDNIYRNGYAEGDIMGANYWSSSEYNADKAWVMHFGLNLQQAINKTRTKPRTRAIRYFAR